MSAPNGASIPAAITPSQLPSSKSQVSLVDHGLKGRNVRYDAKITYQHWLSSPGRVMNIQTQSFNSSVQPVGIVRSYPRKWEIVREDDPIDHVYEVVSGTVCTCKMLREGRRQIAGFHFAGDVFGLESAQHHSVAAQAITNAKVRIFNKRALRALASSSLEVADRLRPATPWAGYSTRRWGI